MVFNISISAGKKNKIFLLNNYSIEKFSKNIEIVNKAYPLFLSKISSKLNKVHNIKWNKKIWEIIIGYWLKRYLIVILDRLTILEKIKKNFFINSFYKTKSKMSLLPSTINDFTTKSLSKEWNEEIFNRLFNYKLKKNKKYLLNLEKSSVKKKGTNIINNLKVKVLNLLTNLYVFIFCKKSKVIISNPYFGNKLKFIFFLIKLKEFPIIYYLDNRPFNCNHSKKIRKNFDLKLNKNEFYRVASTLVSECIPKSYVEGFDGIFKRINKSSLPLEKKIIFTSNIENDSIFKFWVAHQKNKEGKLILAQHGGGFNYFKLDSKRDYELSISDKYLTYGWTYKKFKKKIMKFSIINNNVFEEKSLFKENISIIMSGYDDFISFPSIGNYLLIKKNNSYKELDEISNVLNILNTDIKKKIIIRPHPSKHRVSLTDFEKNYKKIIKIDNKFQIPLFKLLRNSQLNFIPRMSATLFSYCLSKNFPTVTLLPINTKKYLDNNLRKIVNILVKVGICHYDYISLSKFIEKNFNKFSYWWLSHSTQKARRLYCNHYANNLPNKIDLLAKIILDEKKNLNEKN